MNVSPNGNFADEATGKSTGANILHLTRPLAKWAETLGMKEAELAERWEKRRETLYRAREQRIPPLKDDKIMTDWNGLMIGALAMGARILDNDSYAEAAKNAASFITRHLTDEAGGLLHRFRDGHAGIEATANDYAFFIQGLLELFKATFEADYLIRAVSLQAHMIKHFWDEENKGFYLTAHTAEKLPSRPKELHDGATPSANSIAFSNLLLLSRLTGESTWQEKAMEMSHLFAGTVKHSHSAFAHFMTGLECAVGSGFEVVIAGRASSPETQKMLATVKEKYLPNSVVILKSSENQAELAEIAPYTKPLKELNGTPTAYVCSHFACAEPTNDVEKLNNMLENKQM